MSTTSKKSYWFNHKAYRHLKGKDAEKTYTKEDEIAISRFIDKCKREYEKDGVIRGHKI